VEEVGHRIGMDEVFDDYNWSRFLSLSLASWLPR
jgi:hypothetical protein